MDDWWRVGRKEKSKRGWKRGTLASWKRNSPNREPSLFHFWSSAHKLCDLESYPPYIQNNRLQRRHAKQPIPLSQHLLSARNTVFEATNRNLPTIPIGGPNFEVLLLTFPKHFQHCFHDIIFQTVRHPHRLSSGLGIE